MVSGFRWILGRELAGSAQPGLLADLDADLDWLRAQGIARIVSLTAAPLQIPAGDPDFELIHFPIPDMGIPTPRACAGLCESLVEGLAQRPVLLHCRGGLGRTGTIAACCLVELGRGPADALIEVRRANPNFVQTQTQAKFIEHYAAWIGSQDAPAEASLSRAGPGSGS